MEEPIALVFEDKNKLVKGFTEFFIDLLNQKGGRFSIALQVAARQKYGLSIWPKSLKMILTGVGFTFIGETKDVCLLIMKTRIMG